MPTTTSRIYQLNVSMPMYTNIPEDVIVNTFHFVWNTGDPSISDMGVLFDLTKTFYDALYSGPARASYTGNVLTMKLYNLHDLEPRVPLLTGTRTMANTPANTTLPTEVAICLSFKATPIGGIAPARQRGRMFLGALGSGLSTSSATAFPEIPSATRVILNNAAAAYNTTTLAAGWAWHIYSPAQTREFKLPESFKIVGGWTDNSPDTQRRRSVAATSRSVW